MINKILLKNTASYREKEAVLETNKKVNLIYGLNGTGKTTLSSFLYRPDDDKFRQCSFEERGDNEIIVYNKDFVDENFFSPDGLPGIFTLSKENKDILEEIKEKEDKLKGLRNLKDKKTSDKEKLVKEESDKSNKAQNNTWKIKDDYHGGDRVLEFCLSGLIGSKKKLFDHLKAISKQESIDYTIKDLKQEAQEVLGASAPLGSIKKIDNFFEDIEHDPIFKKTVIGNANSSVSGLIEELDNSDWVKMGLRFINKDALSNNDMDCPFCQEKTVTSYLVEQIEEYFGHEFEKDLNKVESLEKKYRTGIESLPDEGEFFQNLKVQEVKESFQLKYRELITNLKRNLSKIQQKIDSPSNSIELQSSKGLIENFNAIVDEINEAIAAHNQKINKKHEVKENIKKQFWNLMRFQYSQTIDDFNSYKSEHMVKMKNLEEEIAKLNQDEGELLSFISQRQKDTVNIEEAVSNINSHLQDMGISHIQLVKHEGSESYKIQRDGASSDIYKTLSEGEKTVITFLYFIERCRGKKSPMDSSRNKVVLIDDPISSLSHIYVFNVSRLIQKEFFDSKVYAQTFVMTHNLYFYYELAKQKRRNNPENNQGLFRIHKNSDGSQISEMRFNEIQNDYEAYWSIIKDENTPPILLANCMRNVLEHFFGFVDNQESLNNIFQNPELQKNKFQAFLRYMNRESHSNTINISDYKDIDHEHFKEAFELVFKVLNYEKHYKQMIR